MYNFWRMRGYLIDLMDIKTKITIKVAPDTDKGR